MNKKILNHFKKRDPVLYKQALKVGRMPVIKRDKPENYFYKLCREIVCQQLSDKAGMTIFSRFQKLFPKRLISVSGVLALSEEQLRGAGMSYAKARYVRNLAKAIIDGDLPILNLDSLADTEILTVLTKIKGIGPWTAEMFLMFTLAREDIFSEGDLALRKGLKRIYKFKSEPTKKEMIAITSNWSPYKTYGSRIVWATLDTDL